jgi:glycerol-3-phosphate acyltransferase PlsY
MTSLLIAIGAYLIGSIAFAVIVSRAFGLPDPRSYGSGNPGATNVLRSGRKPAAALTLVGDCAKGWVAVYLAARLAEPAALEATMAAAGVAVVIGHIFPVFFRFQGGKGVATVLGALFALNIYVAVGAVATWVMIATFFRISSLAALVSALFAPFFTLFIYKDPANPIFICVAAMSALLVWRHAANIRKLMAGTESRIGNKNRV